MRGSSFGYLIRVGIKSVFKNRLMSFASIGVLAACLMLIGWAGLLSLNVNSIVGYVESQNEVMVIADDNIDAQGLDNLDLDLHTVENLYEITLVPKSESLQSYKERLGEDGELLNELEGEENPLPDAFRVRVKDLAFMSETVGKIEGFDGVQRVNAPTEIASAIVSIKQAVYIGGVGIVGILFIVALIIIANTIKITVFNRRKEINIMKYVGATDSFIKLPFIIEGIMLGIMAAMIAYFVVWGSYEYLVSWMSGSQTPLFAMFKDHILPFMDISIPMAGAFGGGGVIIGVGGSMIFVRRYLRV